MFLNIIELAQSFGVEERQVQEWLSREGLPHIADRGRLLFDRAQVAAWAESHGLAGKAGFLAPSPSQPRSGARLQTLLRAGGIWRDVPAAGVLKLLSEIVAKIPGATPPVRQLLENRLHAPDGISWALVGGGVGLPHLRSPVTLGRDAGIFAVLMLSEPLSLAEPAPDNQPVRNLLFFLAPSPRAHLEMLALLSKALASGGLGQVLREGAPDHEIHAALDAASPSNSKDAAA